MVLSLYWYICLIVNRHQSSTTSLPLSRGQWCDLISNLSLFGNDKPRNPLPCLLLFFISCLIFLFSCLVTAVIDVWWNKNNFVLSRSDLVYFIAGNDELFRSNDYQKMNYNKSILETWHGKRWLWLQLSDNNKITAFRIKAAFKFFVIRTIRIPSMTIKWGKRCSNRYALVFTKPS